MQKLPVVLCRTSEVCLSDLKKLWEIVEDLGVPSAPVAMPVSYPMDCFDWDKTFFDANCINQAVRRQLCLGEFPIIILVGEKVFLQDNPYCTDEGKSCTINAEGLSKRVVVRALKKLGVL